MGHIFRKVYTFATPKKEAKKIEEVKAMMEERSNLKINILFAELQISAIETLHLDEFESMEVESLNLMITQNNNKIYKLEGSLIEILILTCKISGELRAMIVKKRARRRTNLTQRFEDKTEANRLEDQVRVELHQYTVELLKNYFNDSNFP